MDSNNSQQAWQPIRKTPGEVGCLLSCFYYSLAEGAVIGPLPRLAEHTHTQLSQVSFLFPASALGYLIGSILAGRLYDRLPGHRILVTVLLVVAGALTLTPLAASIWVLTGILLVLNICTGSLDVGGNTLLVWCTLTRLSFLNALHFFFGVGAFRRSSCPVVKHGD
jgi:MFS family permease